METGQEKFAQTQPFANTNDVESMAKNAGLEMADDEELRLKEKLEERDDNRPQPPSSPNNSR